MPFELVIKTTSLILMIILITIAIVEIREYKSASTLTKGPNGIDGTILTDAELSSKFSKNFLKDEGLLEINGPSIEFYKTKKNTQTIEAEILQFFKGDSLDSEEIVIIAKEWDWPTINKLEDAEGNTFEICEEHRAIIPSSFLINELISFKLPKNYIRDHENTGMKFKLTNNNKHTFAFIITGEYFKTFSKVKEGDNVVTITDKVMFNVK
jgi:hypothetical protein